MKMEKKHKRISNRFPERRIPQPSLLKDSSINEEEDEKASPTSVFSLMLIIYVVSAFYYYYLFIYGVLSRLPVRCSKASRTERLCQTFEFRFKRLSPRLFIHFSYFTLVPLLFGKRMQLWWEAGIFFTIDPKEKANKWTRTQKKEEKQADCVIKEPEMVGKDIQSSCSPTLGQTDQSVLRCSFTGRIWDAFDRDPSKESQGSLVLLYAFRKCLKSIKKNFQVSAESWLLWVELPLWRLKRRSLKRLYCRAPWVCSEH